MTINHGCSYPGCAGSHRARGYCASHYSQILRGGEPRSLRAKREATCSFDGCDQPHYSGGYCTGHYGQIYRGYDLTPIRKPRKGCVFPGCEKPHVAHGYCNGHARQRRAGETLRPLRVIQRRGGEWHVNSNGYVQRFLPGLRTAEFQHRFVMEQNLGRKMLPHETVHHVNGDRSDNRLENLELWSHSQPYGQRVVDKVDWALEILRIYRPELLQADPARS